MKASNSFTVAAAAILALCACSNPQPGPDKTVAGAVLGAGWGAGAGAVVGHQVSAAGEGAAIGAGFGLVGGAMTGAGYDLNESAMIDQENQLASLRVQNAANAEEIVRLQDKFDRASSTSAVGGVYQVFFDVDQTNLKAGSVANLEVIADSIKRNPNGAVVNVVGHADDSGNVEHNDRLAEARARNVASYLGARGLSMDRIVIKSFGAKRPVASNTSATGRQLNRRVDVYMGQ